MTRPQSVRSPPVAFSAHHATTKIPAPTIKHHTQRSASRRAIRIRRIGLRNIGYLQSMASGP